MENDIQENAKAANLWDVRWWIHHRHRWDWCTREGLLYPVRDLAPLVVPTLLTGDPIHVESEAQEPDAGGAAAR